jgi:TonB family protein
MFRQMFSQSQPEATERVRGKLPQIGSLLAHGALLVWMLQGPRPMILTPTSLKAGIQNGAVTQLYWPNRGGESTASSEAQTNKRMSQTALLNWRPPHETKRRRHGLAVSTEDAQTQQSTEQASSLPPVGSPFGSSAFGLYAGADVRPALPVVSRDPFVSIGEVGEGVEGDVVIEITIDEKGNIVEKKVVKSLNPVVDLRVLAALEGWRFQPATKNGIAIESKQDVSYHYPSAAVRAD